MWGETSRTEYISIGLLGSQKVIGKEQLEKGISAMQDPLI